MKPPLSPLLLLLGIAAGAASIGTRAVAQNYPWCANFADGAGINCGFSTLEQCMATSAGSGGSCARNNQYSPAAVPAAGPHRAPKRHAGKNS